MHESSRTVIEQLQMQAQPSPEGRADAVLRSCAVPWMSESMRLHTRVGQGRSYPAS